MVIKPHNMMGGPAMGFDDHEWRVCFDINQHLEDISTTSSRRTPCTIYCRSRDVLYVLCAICMCLKEGLTLRSLR